MEPQPGGGGRRQEGGTLDLQRREEKPGRASCVAGFGLRGPFLGPGTVNKGDSG